MNSIQLTTVPNIPHIQSGDNLAQMLLQCALAAGITIEDDDVLVITHKIVSKAEGRSVKLASVTPGTQALEVAAQCGKDPRVVELILQESEEISRVRPGLIIVRHKLGFTSANAGIDRSNVAQEGGDETVLLLPEDPDGSAEHIRQAVQERSGSKVGIVIADSHGRPFRLGTVGVAIGVAGLPALWDRRGESDLYGYELEHTDVGTADEIAAAAGLLMGQAAEGTPVVLVRGLRLPPFAGQARDLIRPAEADLYR
jgi:coenzyme F420-0:L-glutamate ligase/coenzyme F420-1:gamma-L-glutamate ligase